MDAASRWAPLLLSCLLVLPRAGAAAVQDRVDVPGTVVDVTTGEPVPDVYLHIDSTAIAVLSDPDGRFLLPAVPTGTWTLVVEHVAYGRHEHRIAVDAPHEVVLRVRLAPRAVEIEPLVVEGETSLQREARTTGASFREVTRAEIVAAIGTSRHMGDLLRRTVPSLRLRQAPNLSATDVCLEFRGAAAISIVNARPCNHPMVLLDGVVVTNPQYLYGSVGMENLERIQVIPPGEAGVRYGTGALYGVILIETRRPGRRDAGVPAPPGRLEPFAFDWRRDPAGHPTRRAVLWSATGNALGLAAGVGLASRCIEVTEDDDFRATCDVVPTVLAGVAAVALPALGSALGARHGGGTDRSVGRTVPALLGAGMLLFPGYAFSLSTVGGGQEAVNAVGWAFLAVGVPVATAMADRLFRRLR